MLLKAVQYTSAKGSRAAFSYRGSKRISLTAFSWQSPSEFFSTSFITKRMRSSSTSIFVKVASEVDGQFYEEGVSFLNSNSNNNVDESIEHVQQQIQSHFNFPLDNWQLSAGAAILADQNVIVCAPTGYVLLICQLINCIYIFIKMHNTHISFFIHQHTPIIYIEQGKL